MIIKKMTNTEEKKNFKPTHNLVVATSTYEKDDKTKYRNFTLGTMFKTEKWYTIKLSDVATNVLKTALWSEFEWWVNVFAIKDENWNPVEDDLPF